MFQIFLFVFGAAIGSFLNVLIDRLLKGESIGGRSYCDYCHRPLAWYHLVPIVSYIVLGGKCGYCGKNISLQYPLVEFLTGAMFILTWQFSPSMIFLKWVYLGIIACLIVVFFSDVKYHLIPDSIQVVFFLLSLLAIGQGITLMGFVTHVVSGFLSLLPIFFLWLITRGGGMGFGDVKLSFTIGFLLGAKAGFLALYFAFIIGGLVGLFLILLGKKKLKSKIAFGPFLVLGTIIMLFFSDKIWLLISSIYRF